MTGRRGSKNESPVTTRSSSLTAELFKESLENLRKELKNDILQLKIDLRQEMIKSIESAIEQSLRPLHERINSQEKELNALRGIVLNREMEVLKEERRRLSTSLVISGIRESENEKPPETRKIVDDLLNSIESDVNILSVERVGKMNGKFHRSE